MTKFKFRVWIKISQQFATWEDICHKKNLHRLIDNPDYLLMQYTGLKDKSGIEIWEHDYISIIIPIVHGLDKVKTYLVEYREGAFCLINEDNTVWTPLYKPSFTKQLFDSIKVVGNKYEGIKND